MRILIVDDQSTMRNLIRGMLEKSGFRDLDEAEDGDVALNKVKQEGFDLVISDLHMPRMSGLEFLKETRSTKTIQNTPILMVTTESSKDAVLEAIKWKVNGYIVKPFTPDTLREKLEKLGITPEEAKSGFHVEEWLNELGLSEYAEAFASNDITPESLPELTSDDLKGIGVASLGHRKILLAAIEEQKAS